MASKLWSKKKKRSMSITLKSHIQLVSFIHTNFELDDSVFCLFISSLILIKGILLWHLESPITSDKNDKKSVKVCK